MVCKWGAAAATADAAFTVAALSPLSFGSVTSDRPCGIAYEDDDDEGEDKIILFV